MEVESTTHNVFQGGMVYSLPPPVLESTPAITRAQRRQLKNQKEEDKRKKFYLERFENWGTQFYQAYLMNINHPQLSMFYNPESMLTFIQGSNQANFQGQEQIMSHMGMFQSLTGYELQVFQIQPCSDNRSVYIILSGTLTPTGSPPVSFHTTMVLGKGEKKTLEVGGQPYTTPQYIHNQTFVIS